MVRGEAGSYRLPHYHYFVNTLNKRIRCYVYSMAGPSKRKIRETLCLEPLCNSVDICSYKPLASKYKGTFDETSE